MRSHVGLMKYRRVTGGQVPRRRPFRVLSALIILLFGGGATFPAWAAVSGDEPGAMFGAAICLGLGSVFTSSHYDAKFEAKYVLLCQHWRHSAGR